MRVLIPVICGNISESRFSTTTGQLVNKIPYPLALYRQFEYSHAVTFPALIEAAYFSLFSDQSCNDVVSSDDEKTGSCLRILQLHRSCNVA